MSGNLAAIASNSNRFKAIKIFLKHGTDPNSVVTFSDGSTQSLLYKACIVENASLVKDLLAHKDIDPNKGKSERNWSGFTLYTSPLFKSIYRMNLNIAEAILKHPCTDKTCGSYELEASEYAPTFPRYSMPPLFALPLRELFFQEHSPEKIDEIAREQTKCLGFLSDLLVSKYLDHYQLMCNTSLGIDGLGDHYRSYQRKSFLNFCTELDALPLVKLLIEHGVSPHQGMVLIEKYNDDDISNEYCSVYNQELDNFLYRKRICSESEEAQLELLARNCDNMDKLDVRFDKSSSIYKSLEMLALLSKSEESDTELSGLDLMDIIDPTLIIHERLEEPLERERYKDLVKDYEEISFLQRIKKELNKNKKNNRRPFFTAVIRNQRNPDSFKRALQNSLK